MSIVYVYKKATGANNGTSWTDAYTELYTAVNNASAGDELWVAQSNGFLEWYHPGPGVSPSTEVITVNKPLTIYGGMPVGSTSISERTFDKKSILNGQSNSFHSLLKLEISTGEFILDNFDIVNFGTTSSYPIIVDGTGPEITQVKFKNCLFEGNVSSVACVYELASNNSVLAIENCYFTRNEGKLSSCISKNSILALYVNNSAFFNNKADSTTTTQSGAIYSIYETTIDNCVFKENEGDLAGAVYIVNYGAYTIDINHCVFYKNKSTANPALYGSGGALRIATKSDESVKNSIFWENESTLSSNGNQIYVINTSSTTVSFEVQHCCIQDGISTGAVLTENSPGNIVVSDDGTLVITDPLFREPSLFGFDAHSFLCEGQALDGLDIGIVGNDVSDFEFFPTSGFSPLSTTAVSTGRYKWGYEFDFLWEIDGVSKTDPLPTYNLEEAKYYNVSLHTKVVEFSVYLCGFSSAYKYEDSSIKLSYLNVETNINPSFTVTPIEGDVPLNVKFTDTTTGTITSWLWSFGDDGTDTDQNPDRTFAANGLYDVELTVTGPEGSFSTNLFEQTGEDYINVRPVADFNLSSSIISIGDTVNFTDQSLVTICGWVWSWYKKGSSPEDGEIFYSTEPEALNWPYEDPSLTFSSPTFSPGETYVVSLKVYSPYEGTVIDDEANISNNTTTKEVTILAEVSANFTFTPNTGQQPLTVNFEDTSTGGADAWSWDFGDGDTSTSQDPSHTYTENGSYTVTLTATRTSPASTDTITKTVNVSPRAEFEASPVSGYTPLTVQFTDKSVTTVTNWQWYFGDGTSSSSQNPTKTYNQTGTYTVELIVTGPGGSGSATKTDYITADFPGDAYYVDLNKTASGAGTETDPFNYEDFSSRTTSADNSLEYKIRGSLNLQQGVHSSSTIGESNIVMTPWDLDRYGPWRLHVSSSNFDNLNISAKKISGAILATDLDISSGDPVRFNLYLCGSTIENTHIVSHDRLFFTLYGDAYICGSNIVGPSGNKTLLDINSEEDSDPVQFSIKDSIIDFKDLGVTGDSAKLEGSILRTSNTSFNYGGINRIGDLHGITGIHVDPQFDFDIPEAWPDWNAGANASTSPDDSTKWARWSTWGKLVRVGSSEYTEIPTGLFENDRLGIGALYFDTNPTFTVNYTEGNLVSVLDRPEKTCNQFIAIGWVKNPSVSDGKIIYPIAVSDMYGNVLGDDVASFKIGIKREDEDYRLVYSGAQSLLINRSNRIDLADNKWHFLSYVCVNDEGLMKFYVDGIEVPSDTDTDDEGFTKNIARSKFVRIGGGDVYSPYLTQESSAISLYNWRVGFNFTIHQEWLKELMEIDKTNLGI